MKKTFVVMMALMVSMAFASSSFAANQVQMTLTSPTIYKAGCEKVGSTTYSFDGNSEIVSGDWWYMDLPEDITLCKDYNFIVTGNATVGNQADPNIYVNGTNYTNVGFNGVNVYSFAGGVTGNGPIRAGGNNQKFTVSGSNMAFLVKGTKNTRRITIYTLDDGTTAKLTVDSDSTFQVKLFDGNAYSMVANGTGNTSIILLDTDGDGIYGENSTGTTDDEVIGGNVLAEGANTPYVENTLCVDATQLSGQYIYTSYASKSDKFTFSGDSQIAHTAAASTIALAACKGDTADNINIEGGQTGTCKFEYETKNSGDDYCNDATFENRILIEASSGAFGDIDDKYFVTLELTSPNDGVYFGGYFDVYAFKSSEKECEAYALGSNGTKLYTGASGNSTIYEGSTKKTTAWTKDTDCAVAEGQLVTKIEQSGNYMDLDDYDTIWVDMNDFVYTNASVAANEEVIVKVTLNRYPCGEILSDSRTIGTFVTACAGAESTTLYFPWLPGKAIAGWWGGMVITNVGDVAGTAELTYSTADGKKATYTTPSVAAGAQWLDENTVSDLTLVDTDFTMDGNYSVKAVCAFAARGFAFTGNFTEGTGYLANGFTGTGNAATDLSW